MSVSATPMCACSHRPWAAASATSLTLEPSYCWTRASLTGPTHRSCPSGSGVPQTILSRWVSRKALKALSKPPKDKLALCESVPWCFFWQRGRLSQGGMPSLGTDWSAHFECCLHRLLHPAGWYTQKVPDLECDDRQNDFGHMTGGHGHFHGSESPSAEGVSSQQLFRFSKQPNSRKMLAAQMLKRPDNAQQCECNTTGLHLEQFRGLQCVVKCTSHTHVQETLKTCASTVTQANDTCGMMRRFVRNIHTLHAPCPPPPPPGVPGLPGRQQQHTGLLCCSATQPRSHPHPSHPLSHNHKHYCSHSNTYIRTRARTHNTTHAHTHNNTYSSIRTLSLSPA